MYFQRCDGTVIRVYGPAPSPDHLDYLNSRLLLEDPRVRVPQLPYSCGNAQNWERKPPILFFEWGCLGMKLSDAAEGEFKGMNNRSDPRSEGERGITIRIHVGS
jgi:hypothetical protein